MSRDPEQHDSPWARPAPGASDQGATVSTPPTSGSSAGPDGTSGTGGTGGSTRPDPVTRYQPSHPTTGGPAGRPDPVNRYLPSPPHGRGAAGTGLVTGLDEDRVDVISGGSAKPPTDRRRLLLFGGVGGGLAVVGLVVVLVLTMAGTFGGKRGIGPLGGESTPDTRPPLAKLCPPPTATAEPDYPDGGPAPAGPRTVDSRVGISYRAYGEPWEVWRDNWSGGTLKVHYLTGQFFVTEMYPGGTYLASVLSGSVPATVNDGMILDLKCTGRQVAADVRTQYYPQPNTIDMIKDEQTVLGGRPAWVTIFRLHFKESGLKATDELVGVVLVDVGKPEAAVLYVSVPGTHRQYDWVVQDVINSIRPV